MTPPSNISTPTKSLENNKNSSMPSIDLDSSNPEHSSLNSKFTKLKTASRQDENRVNTKRFDRSKLPTFENVSMSEKRSQNQPLNGAPSKKINEKSTDSASSYLQQAGEYMTSLKEKMLNKKID